VNNWFSASSWSGIWTNTWVATCIASNTSTFAYLNSSTTYDWTSSEWSKCCPFGVNYRGSTSSWSSIWTNTWLSACIASNTSTFADLNSSSTFYRTSSIRSKCCPFGVNYRGSTSSWSGVGSNTWLSTWVASNTSTFANLNSSTTFYRTSSIWSKCCPFRVNNWFPASSRSGVWTNTCITASITSNTSTFADLYSSSAHDWTSSKWSECCPLGVNYWCSTSSRSSIWADTWLSAWVTSNTSTFADLNSSSTFYGTSSIRSKCCPFGVNDRRSASTWSCIWSYTWLATCISSNTRAFAYLNSSATSNRAGTVWSKCCPFWVNDGWATSTCSCIWPNTRSTARITTNTSTFAYLNSSSTSHWTRSVWSESGPSGGNSNSDATCRNCDWCCHHCSISATYANSTYTSSITILFFRINCAAGCKQHNQQYR